MPANKQQLVDALTRVEVPGTGQSIVGLNMVQNVEVDGDRATIEVKLSRRTGDHRKKIEHEVTAAAESLGLAADVRFSIELAGGEDRPAGAPGGRPLPNVKHFVAVGAGKGGVGKSTVAINLAVGLARTGLKVGLLDGDIYGPSLPTMLGTDRYETRTSGKMFIPFELHGIKAMTIGALVEDDKPLIWRGPMAHGAFSQLATQTDWGELEYLIIDLPPGTGDVPLTMSQLLPLTGAVVVCTPQKVAQDDARRAIAMFRQLDIELLGLVENMSYFIGDDGKEYDIFGRGGAEMLAQQQGVPFLGSVPINTALRRHSDAGDPSANFESGDTLADELTAVTRALARQVAVQEATAAPRPTLNIH